MISNNEVCLETIFRVSEKSYHSSNVEQEVHTTVPATMDVISSHTFSH